MGAEAQAPPAQEARLRGRGVGSLGECIIPCTTCTCVWPSGPRQLDLVRAGTFLPAHVPRTSPGWACCLRPAREPWPRPTVAGERAGGVAPGGRTARPSYTAWTPWRPARGAARGAALVHPRRGRWADLPGGTLAEIPALCDWPCERGRRPEAMAAFVARHGPGGRRAGAGAAGEGGACAPWPATVWPTAPRTCAARWLHRAPA
jgi:hypothetical protein